MLSRSYETTRIASMVNAMRESGPMSVPELVKKTGWSHETIRTQIRKSASTFQQLTNRQIGFGGSTAATFYLTEAALGVTEEEMEKQTDEIYRDVAWWPKPDHVVISAINAMIKSGAQTWHR